MKQVLATCLVAMLVCTLSVAHSQQVRVTITPQALSFPELAQRLCVAGYKVECSPRLRECAAVVCLRNRPWEQARDLLATGLSVEFHKQKEAPNTWPMVRDTQSALREQRWRDGFVQGIHDEMQAQAAHYVPYLTEPYGKVRDKHAQLRQEYKTAFADNEQQQTEASRSRVNQISGEAKSLPDPQEWMAAKLLTREHSAAILETLQNGYAVTEVDPTVLADRELLTSLIASASGHSYSEEPTAQELAANYRAYAGFSFDPQTLLFSTHVLVCDTQAHTQEGDYLRVALARGEHLVDSVFGGSADSAYKGLGKDAQHWLEDERRASQAFLQTPLAQQPLTPLAPETPAASSAAITSISQVVEAWCGQKRREAICELFPAREGLPPNKPLTRLRDAFDPHGAWTLRDQQGVLLVTDQLAFVDRLRSFPLASLLTWERAQQQTEVAPHTPAQSNFFAATLHYAQSVTARQNGTWLSLRGRYRGHTVSDLGCSRPLALLLRQLTEAQWRTFETAQTQSEGSLLPLSRFTRDIPEVVESYRALRYANGRPLVAGSLHPRFEERIRNAALHLYYANAEAVGHFNFMAELTSPSKDGQEGETRSLEAMDGTLEALCPLLRLH